MDDIKKWLSDAYATFEEGYALYLKRGRNRHLMQYLSRKKDMGKLHYELSKFLPRSVRENTELREMQATVEAPDIDNGEIRKPHEHLKIVSDGEISYNRLPDALKPVYQMQVEIYREMRSIHERMKLAETDDERSAARSELLALDEKRRAAWVIIDEWAATGKSPEGTESADTEAEAEAEYKTIGTARVAVTRYIKELDGDPDMDADKQAALIEKARKAVEVVTAAGGKFERLLEPLMRYGIISR